MSLPDSVTDVVAYSSGNHAQAVARAASRRGMRAVIVMPEDAPALKIEGTRAYGAEIVTYDRYAESREKIGGTIAAERNAELIRPSDFSQLGTEIKRLEEGGADMIHVDVMDGHFVPNLTIGPPVIKALRKHCSLKFDVHLMISPVHKYIEAYADAGADIITVHPEATDNLEDSINKIKDLKKNVGVSLNPETSIDLIKNLLNKIDLVLIMSVNPGFGGQKFMPEVLEKIKELKKIREIEKLNFDIEIDGGINFDNCKIAIEAGANILVSGTTVFKSNDGDIKKNINLLKTK